MDITQHNFSTRLLDILEAITEAEFIAIDCEFSGVASGRMGRGGSRGQQTLQERYAETKAAAERYQVLQLGLTCVKAEEGRKVFIFKTFNIPVSPILDEDLGVPRDFTFQSGAIQFLLRNAFDIESTLDRGVQYLSEGEEQKALQVMRDRLDTSRIADIDIPADDTAAHNFLANIRKQVDDWVAVNPSTDLNASLSISYRTDAKGAEQELSSYDRRLIHQIVRAQYPKLQTSSKSTTITIRYKNEKREKEFQARKRQRLEDEIHVHVGLRWIIDALSANSIEKLNMLALLSRGTPGDYDFYETNRRHSKIRDRIKPATLVGHNVFVDLVHLYACFIGPLPETVEDFAQIINSLYPIVIDTKYVATHDCGTAKPASALEHLDALTIRIPTPEIKISPGHNKYEENDKANHEAGFDSLVTARVMLRLAGVLAKEDGRVPALDEDFWKVYKNKLRVFGTEESLLTLDRKSEGVSIVANDLPLQTLALA